MNQTIFAIKNKTTRIYPNINKNSKKSKKMILIKGLMIYRLNKLKLEKTI